MRRRSPRAGPRSPASPGGLRRSGRRSSAPPRSGVCRRRRQAARWQPRGRLPPRAGAIAAQRVRRALGIQVLNRQEARGLKRQGRATSVARPLGARTFPRFAVDLEVHALVVEADEPLHLEGVAERLLVAPCDRLLAGGVVVGGVALVGAGGPVVAPLET